MSWGFARPITFPPGLAGATDARRVAWFTARWPDNASADRRSLPGTWAAAVAPRPLDLDQPGMLGQAVFVALQGQHELLDAGRADDRRILVHATDARVAAGQAHEHEAELVEVGATEARQGFQVLQRTQRDDDVGPIFFQPGDRVAPEDRRMADLCRDAVRLRQRTLRERVGGHEPVASALVVTLGDEQA